MRSRCWPANERHLRGRFTIITPGLQWVRFLSNIGKQRTGSFCSKVRGQVSLALGGSFVFFFCCCCFPIFFFYGTIWFRVCQAVGFIELSGNRILSRALNPRHLVRGRPRLVSRRLQYLRNPSSQTKALVPPNKHTHTKREEYQKLATPSERRVESWAAQGRIVG